MQWQKLDFIFVGGRQRVSPFPNYISFEIMCRDMRQFVPVVLRDSVVVFEKNISTLFAPRRVWEGTSRAIAQSVFDNPQLFAELTAEHEKHAGSFISFTKEAARELQSGKATAERLVELYEGFEPRYRLMYTPYAPVWVVSDALPAALYEIILQYEKDPVKAAEMLDVLTQEPSAMVSLTERTALLTLASNIVSNPDWVCAVKEGKTNEMNGLRQLIEKHQQGFFWITRDYEDPILMYADVVKRLADTLANDPRSALRTLELGRKALEQKRAHFITSLGISSDQQALFAAMRAATHLKELRKRTVSEALYYFDAVLQEIARRMFLTIAQVRFLKTKEVRDALLGGKDMMDALNERMRLSLWCCGEGTDTEVITGKDAQDFRDRFIRVNKNTTEFQGVGVSPGVARGPVKIVMNPDECGKVERGDVIVSIQVVPSFSTAIMKAAALVCDGGTGITSHPATLAREAGIPGVIQTRFAREVLKDGDVVQVDGYEGVVRKVA